MNTKNLSEHAFATELNEDKDCGCTNTDMPKNPKSTQAFDNKLIIKEIKISVEQEYKFNAGFYQVTDFDWDNTIATDYGSDEYGISVPLISNTDEKQAVLFSAYDKKNNEVGNSIILEMALVSDDVEISYRTLSNEKIVGLVADREKEVIEKEEVINEQVGLIKKNIATAGYTDDVVKCLKTYWDKQPDWVQWLCGGACGSVIWGPNPINITGCASCLGAYAMVCLIH